MNILEIAVILFLLASIWHGYRKGLIRVVFSMVALLLTIGIATFLSPYVHSFIKERTEVKTAIQQNITEFVHEAVGERLEGELTSRTDEVWVIDKLPLPKTIRTMLIEKDNQDNYVALGIETFEEYLSASLAEMVLSAIAFLITFLIAQVIIQMLILMLDMIAKIPGIKGINHLAGLFVGLLQGLILVWILCIAVTAFAGLKAGQNIMAMIHQSELLSFIYNNNLLLQIVTNLIEHSISIII